MVGNDIARRRGVPANCIFGRAVADDRAGVGVAEPGQSVVANADETALDYVERGAGPDVVERRASRDEYAVGFVDYRVRARGVRPDVVAVKVVRRGSPARNRDATPLPEIIFRVEAVLPPMVLEAAPP